MDSCYVIRSNGTESIPGWEGIPEAVVLNALLATFCLILLSVVRIIYFRRKPYQNDWNVGWLQFIFSDRNVNILHNDALINRDNPKAYIPPHMWEYADRIENKVQERDMKSDLYVETSSSDRMKKKHQEKLDSVGKDRFWLLDYLLIKDKDIYDHRGLDAFQYLLFQRYIIYFLTALTAVCMIILMPINIFGKTSNRQYFEMTTINNIDGSSDIFWVHTIIAISVVILGLVMMKNFSDLIFASTPESEDRTILIQNIPESKRKARMLQAYIEKKFMGVEVTQITFTYATDMLFSMKQQQKTIQSALIYSSNYEIEYGYPLRVSKYYAGRFLPLETVDATEYYIEQQKEYRVLVEEEVNRLITDPQHAVFVKLRNELMAHRILEHCESTQHERVIKRFCRYIKSWFVSKSGINVDSFDYNNWVIKPAPYPDDIEWYDIIMNTNTSGAFDVLLNIIVLVIFIFLTTPLVAISFLGEIVSKIGMNDSITPINEIQIGASKIQLAKYFSILIVNTISIILPNLIMFIVLHTPRNTKSEKTYRAMIGVYLFLLCMVFICPSIGLMFDSSESSKNLYHCLFPAASSAWFVQYVISSIFLNPLEIMRLADLSLYILNCIIYPRTEAEFLRARIETNFDFNYASSYPRFLLIFTIVTTYSIACPIIAPFGLLYMIFKYLVDRYNIYYLYYAPVISPHIHQMAIMFVLGSFFFLLLQLTAFLNSRIEFSLSFKPSNVCSVALLLYIILMCFTWCNFSYLYPKDAGALSEHQQQNWSKNSRRLRSNKLGNETQGHTTITKLRAD
ncbi:Transmembrane protein 63C [Blomia tropicalis]|nr:Transmembrane protein 63C [Blomia tropicalis]